jgi:peptidoglycan/LPS O-acetylase OafA/YrhL
MSKAGVYIKSLDGIRAIAILMVMAFHANLLHFGWMGVELFFVLSGFLITTILWEEKFKQEPRGEKFKRFWIRRSLRIFPLYYGFLLFLGITYLVFHFPGYYTTYIPYLATYTVNYTRLLLGWQGNPLFTHLWSLAVEEQFYLFFPLVIFLCPPKVIKGLMLSMLVLSPVIRFVLGEYYKGHGLAPHVVGDAVYWNTLSQLDAFFIGGLIPVLSLHRKITAAGKAVLLSFSLVVIAGIVNYIFSTPEHPFLLDFGYSHAQTANYNHVWSFTLLNLFFASVILYLVTKGVNMKRYSIIRLLQLPVLVNIGKVSYGMYVFHWAVWVYLFQRLFPEGGMAHWLLFIPYAFVVYGVAWLSYRFYESYFLKLKDRFFPRKVPAVPNPTSAIKA